LTVLLLIVCILLLSGAAVAQDAAPSWCISVWYPSSEDPGGADSIKANLDLIDMINPFWYTPLPDGTLAAQPGAEDAEQLTEWREAGLVILPSIFSSLWGMLETDQTRAFHIQEIVDLVERMDYDGIDIDYEAFAQSTRDDFSTFIEELSVELHARGHLLSIAVHAKTDDAGSWEGAAAQDWQRLAPAVDVFTVMTYDYTASDKPPGPIAPPEWVTDVLTYAASVTDLSKVRMGLHFYGYSWMRGQPPAAPITWASAQRLINSFTPEVIREDDEARFDLDVRGLPDQTIYFADARTITRRLSDVYEQFPALGGIAIWGLGGEDPNNWDALRSDRPAECMGL
jgi:spore germination protein YaaH